MIQEHKSRGPLTRGMRGPRNQLVIQGFVISGLHVLCSRDFSPRDSGTTDLRCPGIAGPTIYRKGFIYRGLHVLGFRDYRSQVSRAWDPYLTRAQSIARVNICWVMESYRMTR